MKQWLRGVFSQRHFSMFVLVGSLPHSLLELIFLYVQKETLVMEYSCKLNIGVILYCEIMLNEYFQCLVQVKLNRQHLQQKLAPLC